MSTNQNNPLFSVFFVLRNCEEQVEEYLTPFLSDDSLPCEIFIINDASTDGTGQATTSLIEHYEHEHTFYFEHEQRIGTGQSLNELLREMNTNIFMVVDKPGNPVTSSIIEAVEKLHGSPDLAIIPEKSNILNPTLLKELLEKKQFPSSTQVIIQKNKVTGTKLFFNPFIEFGHSVELVLRNGERPGIARSKIFFKTTDEDVALQLSSLDAKTIAFHTDIMVDKKILSEAPDAAATFRSSTHVHTGELINDVYERLLILKNEGHYAEALDLADLILQANPDLLEVEDIKIFLLERLNQYVKASELKHARKRKNLSPQQISPVPQLPDPSFGDKKTKTAKPPSEEVVKKEHKKSEAPKDDLISEALEIEASQQIDPLQIEVEKEKDKDLNTETDETPIENNEIESESPQPEDETEFPHPKIDSFNISVIIPVSGASQAILQNCMIQLSEYEDYKTTELIIVDNACLDDTYAYINQLRENNFFNIKVVKNVRNAGFALAVNQGIDKASGKFICIMHSDVWLQDNSITKLAETLKELDDIGLIGPLTDNCMTAQQLGEKPLDISEPEEADYLDSFMMVMRADLGIKFDTRYGLAWFDDIDFCWQVQDKGLKTSILKSAFVRHEFGATLNGTGHEYKSKTYQQNYIKFCEKWNWSPQLNPSEDPLEELVDIGQRVNVYFPENVFTDRIEELLTAEVKTALSNTTPEGAELEAFIRVMMAAEQRDLLRRLEELLPLPTDEILTQELIDFYYDRSIYSRCKKYLGALRNQNSAFARIYELRIAFGEKDLDLAIDLFNSLSAEFTTNAEIYHIAAKILDLTDDTETAEEFRTMAEQLDPFSYAP